MITPQEAGKIIQEYFRTVTPEQFLRDVQEDEPEFWAELEAAEKAETKGITQAVSPRTRFVFPI